MGKQLTLGAITWYQQSVPMSVRQRLSKQGTSEKARQAIEAGAAPLRTFVVAALPLRMLGSWLSVYGGQGEW